MTLQELIKSAPACLGLSDVTSVSELIEEVNRQMVIGECDPEFWSDADHKEVSTYYHKVLEPAYYSKSVAPLQVTTKELYELTERKLTNDTLPEAADITQIAAALYFWKHDPHGDYRWNNDEDLLYLSELLGVEIEN